MAVEIIVDRHDGYSTGHAGRLSGINPFAAGLTVSRAPLQTGTIAPAAFPYTAMRIPTGNLDTIRSGIDRVLDALNRAAGAAVMQTADGAGLPLLTEALRQLLEVMARVEGDKRIAGDTQTPHRTGSEDITELAEYAFKLQENLAALVKPPGLMEEQALVASLAVDLALWLARHGGRLDSLEAVVDALALIANRTSDTRELERLSAVMGHIIGAVSPLIREDLEKINPGRPWRVLLLNRGIVATRSHDPAAMEDAFALLIRYLPEDAARFFAEGMQQMDALNYPAPVRKVMEKYHRRWTINRMLH
jgi:hypothetical protein